MVAPLERKAPPLGELVDAIGHTPLLRLPPAFAPDVACEVLLKCEWTNPSGSVKDRIALHMVREAERRGDLRPGGTIVEVTSGNTGVALSMVAAALGYRAVIVIPDRMSREKIATLRAYGAEVVIAASDRPPGDPEHCVNVAARTAASIPGAWFANQPDNADNPGAHEASTGPEIWEQCEGRLDAFVAGGGTGGTITGVARALKARDPRIQVIAVDPPGSIFEPYWRTGEMVPPGRWQVEGLGEDLLPACWDPGVIDGFEIVDDGPGFRMARELARRAGLFGGGSSGLVLLGALRVARRLPAHARLVVLLADGGDRYLSKVFADDWMRDHGHLPSGDATVRALLRGERLPVLAPEAPLEKARWALAEQGAPLVVVAEGERLLGVVDERLLAERLADGVDFEEVAVRGVLRLAPPLLRSGAPWQAAQAALADHARVLVRDGADYASLDRADLLRSLPRVLRSGEEHAGIALEA